MQCVNICVDLQGRVTVIVDQVYTGASVQQHLDHLQFAVGIADGTMQGRVAVHVPDVDVEAQVQELLDDIGIDVRLVQDDVEQGVIVVIANIDAVFEFQ